MVAFGLIAGARPIFCAGRRIRISKKTGHIIVSPGAGPSGDNHKRTNCGHSASANDSNIAVHGHDDSFHFNSNSSFRVHEYYMRGWKRKHRVRAQNAERQTNTRITQPIAMSSGYSNYCYMHIVVAAFYREGTASAIAIPSFASIQTGRCHD